MILYLFFWLSRYLLFVCCFRIPHLPEFFLGTLLRSYSGLGICLRFSVVPDNSNIFLTGGIIVIGDPVPFMNNFFFRSFSLLPYSVCSFLRFSFCIFCGVYILLIHLMFRLGRQFLLRLVFSLFGCWYIFVCIPLHNVLFFRICCNLFLLLDIYVMVISSVPHKICMVFFPVGLSFGLAPNVSILCIGSSE